MRRAAAWVLAGRPMVPSGVWQRNVSPLVQMVIAAVTDRTPRVVVAWP
jgi:hypothetical protein